MFDPIIKLVSDTYGRALVGFFQRQLGLPVGGDFDVIQPNLPQPTVEADRVFRVSAPDTMLIHTEWESASKLERPNRFLEYNVLLTKHTGLTTQTVVVLLRKEANSSDLTGLLTRTLPSGKHYLAFEYDVIRLYELPQEVMLSEVGLTPFAPLCAVTEPELPALAREIESRWATLDTREAADLLNATRVLMGFRYSKPLIHGLFREIVTMEESVIYQEILEKGRVKGTNSGRLLEARANILRLGERRFGVAPRSVNAGIEACSDLERLHRMFDKVIDAPDWASVLATE